MNGKRLFIKTKHTQFSRAACKNINTILIGNMARRYIMVPKKTGKFYAVLEHSDDIVSEIFYRFEYALDFVKENPEYHVIVEITDSEEDGWIDYCTVWSNDQGEICLIN